MIFQHRSAGSPSIDLSAVLQLPPKILTKLFNFQGARIFFDGYQTFVLKSFSELVREIEKKPKVSYLSNYLIKENGIKLLYLFWDWDTKEVDIPSLIDRLKQLKTASLITETKRGFHLYVFLDDGSRIPTSSEKKLIAEALELEDPDKQFKRRIFTLARVPGSYQNGFVVRVIFAQNGRFLKFEGEGYNEDYGKPTPRPICPGIVEDILSPNPSHFGRFAFVAFLAAQGRSEEDIMEIFRNLRPIDFNERMTEYQIRHIVENAYHPPSCTTLRDMGYCRDKCIFRKWR